MLLDDAARKAVQALNLISSVSRRWTATDDVWQRRNMQLPKAALHYFVQAKPLHLAGVHAPGEVGLRSKERGKEGARGQGGRSASPYDTGVGLEITTQMYAVIHLQQPRQPNEFTRLLKRVHPTHSGREPFSSSSTGATRRNKAV